MISAIQEPASLYPLPTSRPVKVALYARVSLEKEEEDPRFQDPENQLAPLRKYAADQGCSIFDEYADKISGARRSRPQLDRLIRDAKGHRFSLVLTTKVDRFSRSPLDCYLLLKDLYDQRVRVRFIDQPEASTDTEQGELVLGILVHFAQFERRVISSRTKAGIVRYRAQKGRWGRRRLDLDLKKFAALRAEKRSLREIARELQVSEWTVRSRLREEKGDSVSSSEESSEKRG